MVVGSSHEFSALSSAGHQLWNIEIARSLRGDDLVRVWNIRRWLVLRVVACLVAVVLRLGVWVTRLALAATIIANWAAGACVTLRWLASVLWASTISTVISGSVFKRHGSK